jgi:hypothetical protein
MLSFRSICNLPIPVITNEPSGNFVVAADIGSDGKVVSCLSENLLSGDSYLLDSAYCH